MKYLVYLVAVCATVELGATHKWVEGSDEVPIKVGSIFNMDLHPELMDEDDKRGYTKQEAEAIEYLKEYNQSRSFIATLVTPSCDLSEWMYPSCCMMIEILDHPHEICVDMALEWRELMLSLSLNHNGEVLFSFEFVLGEICIGLPYMKKIAVCGHVYHIDFKRTPDLFLRACLTVKLNALINLMEVRFYCLDARRTSTTQGILQQTWDLSRSFDKDPPTSAMFAVLIKKDKVAIEFHSPIQQELIDAMKKWMGAAIDQIARHIMVVKNAVVKAWNTVATAATNAWSWCKKWFG